MSQPLPGFESPAAGPDDPLAMLATCHDKLARQCRTLSLLLPHLEHSGADPRAREAAQAVLRYFDKASPQHHKDEEEDLFPALLESMAGSDAVCIRELVDLLGEQHRQLDRAWRYLRGPLVEVAEGRSSFLPGEQIEAFIALNEVHAEKEDTELLPMAQRLLDEAALARIGDAMRRRRNL
jgi:hemerythrin-like domain-containing protein